MFLTRAGFSIISIISALVVTAAVASPTQQPLTGIYSDMAVSTSEPGAGDIGGTEIFVLRGGGKDFVMIQTAEGTPSYPIVVPAVITGTTLTFDLKGTLQADLGRFTGRFEGGRLVGQFTGSQNRVDLPRRKSFWQ